ncbi:calcium-binding protein [Microcoleus sp. CAWBG58]|uniref:calcium-binding protein n=1 Tax=Microcoleus sp. CAWBG58 TaxID=2841651 RepID=UPI0025FF8502|nr:calcium-binding protein [Microcoleus sp. CAWBG58]
MNYDIFDEKYYLSQYPWIKPAIDAGIIKSGREHFEKFGQAAGLIKVSRYFDEDTYLAQNQDVRPFVRGESNPNGRFASGLDHFIQYGYEDGRTGVSVDYDEAFYRANNRDLQPFIQNGTFKNGYEHFIKFGAKEGRFGTSFLETEYLIKNPDLVPFINSGFLKTGREHYFNYWKSNPTRLGTFVGTSGNDTISGGPGKAELIGVEVGIRNGNRYYESYGINEFDVLTGGLSSDTFVLGYSVPFAGSPTGTTSFTLYSGNGQATIERFDTGNDFIQLQGVDSASLGIYDLIPIGNNLSIQRGGDVIGVVEGGASLNLTFKKSNGDGTFLIG